MATDFNTKTIATSGSFKPSIANTPLDIRTIIYSLDDIENIPLPYIGMIFTLVDTTNNILTNYQVKSLKSKFINTIELPDALIDEYEQLNNIFSIKNLIIATNPQGNLKPLDNTGKTDIGENLQAMIDSLPLVNANNPLIRKGTIFLPEGKYALDIKNTITIPIGINIISSSGMKSGYANPIRDFGATIVLKNSNSLTNKNSIILKGKKLNGSASGLSGIRFTGDIGTTNNVVALDGMFNFIIDKCSFDYISCKNALIAISQCNGISLKDSSFTLIGDGGTNGKFTHGNAINFSSCGDSFIENCFIEACGGTGISLGTNCRISNCFVDLNKQGIICMGSENKIMGSTFKLNYYRGGYFSNNGGQSNNNIISDCSFINNCKVTTGISNICSLLLENNKNIKVIDTYFEKSDIVENDIILSGAVEGDIIDCTASNGKDVIIGENKPIINNGVRIFNNKNLTIPTIDALPEANLRNYRKIVILSNSDSEKDKILFCIKEGSSYVWKDITQVTKEDIPTKTSQLVNDSNFLTEHQDLSAYAKKNELHTHSNKAILDNITQNKIDSWDNKSNFDGSYNNLTDTPTIPTKISQLTNDKNYLTSIPSEYITETELTAKGYLTAHQSLSNYALKTELHEHANKDILDEVTSTKIAEWNGKVDKVAGKSLVADAEIQRLSTITNYDDTEIRTAIGDKNSGIIKDIADLKSKSNDSSSESLEINDYDVSGSTVWSSRNIDNKLNNIKTDNMVEVSVVDNIAQLTKDRYQYIDIKSSVEIKLPTNWQTRTITIYFQLTNADYVVTLPSENVKWNPSVIETFTEGKTYEITFNYVNLIIGWTAEYKIYNGTVDLKLDSYNDFYNVLGINKFHNAGITGKGVKIACFDATAYSNIPDDLVLLSGYNGTALPTLNTASRVEHAVKCSYIMGSKKNGICPDAELYACQMTSPADYTTAVDWCIENNIDIIQCSIAYFVNTGSYGNPISEESQEIIRKAITKAKDNGILFINAAGNLTYNDSMQFPGCVLNSFTVGGCNPDNFLEYSVDATNGVNVRIVAPFKVKTVLSTTDGVANIGEESGTSVGCPVVAGIAALIKQQVPEMSAYELQRYLEDSAIKKPDMINRKWDRFIGYGCIKPTVVDNYIKDKQIKEEEDKIIHIEKVELKPEIIEEYGFTYNSTYNRWESEKLTLSIASGNTINLNDFINITPANYTAHYIWARGNNSILPIGEDGIVKPNEIGPPLVTVTFVTINNDRENNYSENQLCNIKITVTE